MQDHEQDVQETSRRLLQRAEAALADELERPLPAGLYLVATPIGNLADISLRALAVLARADLIAAEDTRHSRKLLSHFGIRGELAPYHEHNAARERPRLLARIRAGFSVALISDAGTPLISDPGYKLVREALEEGFQVTSVPGASAALAALTSAGLPTDTFLFAGFLPPKGGQRRKRLEELKPVPATLIFYETASRLAAALADMAEVSAGARRRSPRSSPSCMRAWRAARQPSLPLRSRHRASSRASSWFWSVRLLRTKLRSATRRSWRDSNRR